MSSLRSVVDELAGADIALVKSRQLEDDLVELDHQIGRLHAQRSRRLAEIDQAGNLRGCRLPVDDSVAAPPVPNLGS